MRTSSSRSGSTIAAIPASVTRTTTQKATTYRCAPRCYETSNGTQRVHLTHPAAEMENGLGRICRSCKWFFLEGPERPRRIADPAATAPAQGWR